MQQKCKNNEGLHLPQSLSIPQTAVAWDAHDLPCSKLRALHVSHVSYWSLTTKDAVFKTFSMHFLYLPWQCVAFILLKPLGHATCPFAITAYAANRKKFHSLAKQNFKVKNQKREKEKASEGECTQSAASELKEEGLMALLFLLKDWNMGCVFVCSPQQTADKLGWSYGRV